MDQVDQHMLTDQPSGLLSADEAAALLGVKLPTLYAYVSRGLVRSGPAERGRARRYRRADLERLRARRGARRRRGAEAARALHWGEPVLESSITELTADGPVYRGHSALALAAADTAFESVAELLWTGAVSDARVLWTWKLLYQGSASSARPLRAFGSEEPLPCGRISWSKSPTLV